MTCLGRLTIWRIRFSISKVPVLPKINPTGIMNKSANYLDDSDEHARSTQRTRFAF